MIVLRSSVNQKTRIVTSTSPTGHTTLREYILPKEISLLMELCLLMESEVFSLFPKYDLYMAFNTEALPFLVFLFRHNDAYLVKAVQDCVHFFFPE